MTAQRHEEQKRERRRAEREKQATKLVPLIPILARLGACRSALAWVRDRNAATFREAYEAALPGAWREWLGSRLVSEGITGTCLCPSCVPNARDLAARVERALYNYAVREGLAR